MALVSDNATQAVKVFGDLPHGQSLNRLHKFFFKELAHTYQHLLPGSDNITYVQFYESYEHIIKGLILPNVVLLSILRDVAAIKNDDLLAAHRELQSVLMRVKYYLDTIISAPASLRMEVVYSWSSMDQMRAALVDNILDSGLETLFSENSIGKIGGDVFAEVIKERVYPHLSKVMGMEKPGRVADVLADVSSRFDHLQILHLAINGGTNNLNYPRLKAIMDRSPSELFKWQFKAEEEWPPIVLEKNLSRIWIGK